MIVIASFGRALRMNYGNKVLWWLYILGAIGGGITMQLGMPNMPMIVPQVGADAAIASMLTFFGLFNMQHTVMLFFVPVPMWVLLLLFRPCLYLWEYIHFTSHQKRMWAACLLVY